MYNLLSPRYCLVTVLKSQVRRAFSILFSTDSFPYSFPNNFIKWQFLTQAFINQLSTTKQMPSKSWGKVPIEIFLYVLSLFLLVFGFTSQVLYGLTVKGRSSNSWHKFCDQRQFTASTAIQNTECADDVHCPLQEYLYIFLIYLLQVSLYMSLKPRLQSKMSVLEAEVHYQAPKNYHIKYFKVKINCFDTVFGFQLHSNTLYAEHFLVIVKLRNHGLSLHIFCCQLGFYVRKEQ